MYFKEMELNCKKTIPAFTGVLAVCSLIYFPIVSMDCGMEGYM